MKRRFGIAVVVAFGLFGGQGVERCAFAQPTPVWTERYPDILPAPNAADYPVGVAATHSHIYTGGFKNEYDVRTFRVVKYGRFGDVLAESYWPPLKPVDSVLPWNVKAMVSNANKDTDSAFIFLAGNRPDDSNRQRVATIAFEAGPDAYLKLGWTQFGDSDAEGARNDYAAALAYSVNATGEPVRVITAAHSVLSNGRSQVRVYVLDHSTGGISRIFVWNQLSGAINSNDVPIGVAITGDTVLVAGTSDRSPQGAQRKCMFVVAFNAATGAQISGSPLLLDLGSNYDLEAVAADSGETAVASMFAVAGVRTNRVGDPKKAIYTHAFGLSGSGALTTSWPLPEIWEGTPEQGYDLNIPTTVEVAGYTPPGEIPAGFHVWVGGTTQSTFASKREWLVVQYGEPSAPLMIRREWWDVQSFGASGDDVPAEIRFYEPNENFRRIYVTGAAHVGAGVGDFATLKYDTELIDTGVQNPSTWSFIWAGPVGRDTGVSVFPAPGMFDARSFFVVGPSVGSGTADDWVTQYYIDDAD